MLKGPSPVAGAGELWRRGSDEQGRIRADGHEGPSLVQFGCGGRTVVHEQAAGLAGFATGETNLLEGVEEHRSLHLARHAEIMAEVAGAYEQHVDPIDGRDLLRRCDGSHGLDLDEQRNPWTTAPASPRLSRFAQRGPGLLASSSAKGPCPSVGHGSDSA